MRIPGSRRVVVGVLCLSLRAVAAEAEPVAAPVGPASQDVVHGVVRRAEPAHGLTSLAEDVLLRLAEAEVDGLRRLTQRYERLVDLARGKDDADFEDAVARSVRLHAFVQHLQAQQLETEEREFDRQIDRFLRKTEFLRRQVQAARTESRAGTPVLPPREDLYKRE